MGDKVCPKCGAEVRRQGDSWTYFKCKTAQVNDSHLPYFGEIDQSSQCKDRQIARLEELLDETKTLLARAREWVWYFTPPMGEEDVSELRGLDAELKLFVPDYRERLERYQMGEIT